SRTMRGKFSPVSSRTFRGATSALPFPAWPEPKPAVFAGGSASRREPGRCDWRPSSRGGRARTSGFSGFVFWRKAKKIRAGREFWWDELERVVLGPGPLPPVLELGPGARWRLDDPSENGFERRRQIHRGWRAWEEPPTRRHALYRDLWDRWHGLPERERCRES